MDEYKQPYLILWHGIEDALTAISAQNYGLAADLLKQAHINAEEAFIGQEED